MLLALVDFSSTFFSSLLLDLDLLLDHLDHLHGKPSHSVDDPRQRCTIAQFDRWPRTSSQKLVYI